MIANECPLCQGNLDNLYHTKEHDQSGYHYRCTNPECGHGWHIDTLQRVAYMGLAGKTVEEIREIILKEDENGVD